MTAAHNRISRNLARTQKKQATKKPLENLVIAITVEQIPTAYHSDKRPQGDYAPYNNCQSSSKTLMIGDLFDDKNIKISINNLKKLIKNWNCRFKPQVQFFSFLTGTP